MEQVVTTAHAHDQRIDVAQDRIYTIEVDHPGLRLLALCDVAKVPDPAVKLAVRPDCRRRMPVDCPAILESQFVVAALAAVPVKMPDLGKKRIRIFDLVRRDLQQGRIQTSADKVLRQSPKIDKLLIIGNNLPVLANHQDGIERRLLLRLEDGSLVQNLLLGLPAPCFAVQVVKNVPTTVPLQCSGSDADAASPAAWASDRQGMVLGSFIRSWHQTMRSSRMAVPVGPFPNGLSAFAEISIAAR